MAAARSLGSGAWREADGYVKALPCWAHLPDSDAALALLSARLRTDGLRAYLLRAGGAYASVSLASLAAEFDLSPAAARAAVGRMVIEDGLAGALDAPADCVVMHAAVPTRLQAAVISAAAKAGGLLDLNERAWTLRTGGLRDDEEGGGGGGRGGGGQDGQERRRASRGRGGGPSALGLGVDGRGRGRGRGRGGGGGGGRGARGGGGGGGRGARGGAGRAYGAGLGGVYGDGRESRYTQRRSQQQRFEAMTALGSVPGGRRK